MTIMMISLWVFRCYIQKTMGSRIVPLTNHHSRYFCRPVHGWFWQIMSKIAADFFGSASLVLTGVRWKKSLCDKKTKGLL
jgi:hypothetical protein